MLCAFGAHCENTALWQFGFSVKNISADIDNGEKLYIAGYNQGWEIEGVLDECQARAVCIRAGSKTVLLIGIDSIALDSGTVGEIRKRLSDLKNIDAINVYSTHSHASLDTLGLWGPIGRDGKNSEYMNNLIDAAAEAGREAANALAPARLYYGKVKTENMYRDSRLPIVSDENLYHMRFEPAGGGEGLRMYFYGAHAESLRGDNKLLSRDFPGLLVDSVKTETGDNAMFLPGAIGGLIMTKAFISDTSAEAVKNLTITAEKLTAYALSITPEAERELKPEMLLSRVQFEAALDNPVFLAYKLLGILGTQSKRTGEGKTGYSVVSELNVVLLDDVALALIPGEIFPELVLGGEYGDANPDKSENPRPLKEIAAENGISELLIVGLANDELGYIVPPSDFLVNEKLPFIEKIVDYKGENHYEETNSVGIGCAETIAKAFETAVKSLK